MPPPLLKRSLYTTAILLPLTLYYTLPSKRTTHTMPQEPPTPPSLPHYTATFQVPLTCPTCTTTITNALSPLPLNHTLTTFSIPHNLLTTHGTAPPSHIITAIQSTGRVAVLRGTGEEGSAAVCILETPVTAMRKGGEEGTVRGLVRLAELGDRGTMVDLTVSGLGEGRWRGSVRERGDVSGGRESLGGVFRGEGGEAWLGEVEVGGEGRGSLVGEVGWRVWELVGRGVVVERVGGGEGTGRGEGKVGDEEAVVGVIARSAGVWENDKVVCSCSGKTVWEEREEMVGKGMT